MQRHRRTKIISTLGPASRSPEMIRKLILAGVNVFRLNFSHGSHEEHTETFNRVREASRELGIPIAVLQDLSGPKIRISEIDDQKKLLIDGQEVRLRFANGSQSNNDTIFVNLVNPCECLVEGNLVLLADGLIQLRTLSVTNEEVVCKIIKGGSLRSRVGIAFPDSELKLSATTDKDLVDFEWGMKHGVDYAAISFVQNAADVIRLKQIASKNNNDVKIIAKIEVRAALKGIHEILEEADGIMVARGDLGVEVPIEQLPGIQRELISQANYVGKPVIVATQMLHSMVNSLRPTRAEVVDCSNAVREGADAVMLSEETAIGQNPVESVEYLSKIATEAEKSFNFDEYKYRLRDADRSSVPDAVAYAACAAAVKVEAAAIIACTETGGTAKLMAKYRPQQALYAATRSEEAMRRMCLFWGVRPIAFDHTITHDDELDLALKEVQTLEKLPNGSKAVITGGLAVGKVGSTSVLEIREMTFS
ncbi:MAG: pyruvate kinase [Bdellovibrionales bacterium]|nr:pyruvate kinase [Bdellovibrionales bacterium]